MKTAPFSPALCSRFVRINGRLGWLTLAQKPADDYELHTHFGTPILRSTPDVNILDLCEETTVEDLREFEERKKFINEELGAYYDRRGVYSGD